VTLRAGIDARFAGARYDGVGRYVAQLATELAGREGEPVVCLLPPSPDDAPRHALPAARDGRVVELHPRRALRAESPWSNLEIPRLARGARVDVWHTPFPLAPLRTGAPSVITLHDCIPERYPAYFGSVRRAVYRAWVAAATRRARLVLVPSEMSAEDAQRYYRVRPERLRITPEGVAPAPPADSAGEAAVRRRLGVDVEYLLTVGRPRPHKGYAMLVRALARIEPARRPLLVRVGREDPRLPDGSATLAAELGVRMLALEGLSDAELLAVYRGALLVAIPSSVEGFGLPLLEAMAAGTPVLAADIQPFRATGGGVARIVSGDSESAWAAAVVDSLGDNSWLEGARQEGPRRAAQFPWSACAEATLAAYREAAAP